MNSTPEGIKRPYTATPPEELLARAKHKSANLRRRSLIGGAGSLTVVAALVLIGIFVPSSGAKPVSGKPGRVVVSERIDSAYELTAREPAGRAAPHQVAMAVENAEVGFSIDLLNRLVASTDAHGSANVLVSPSSLSTALAMLELGAHGATEEGIAAALHTAGLSPSEQAAGLYSLAELLAGESSRTGTNLKHEPELNIANALFLQEHFPVLPSFLQALSREFQTGLWEVNFEKDLTGATRAINQWTSDNTKGLIKQLFSPGSLGASTVLVLADAVYFHAKWLSPFENATRVRPFFLGDGGSVRVPFMSSPSVDSRNAFHTPVSKTAGLVAVGLPYAGGKMSALVLMPTDRTLRTFVSSLGPASLAQIVSGMSSQQVQLSMPTFTERADYSLNQTLSSMGMSLAFGPEADLTGIALQPPLYVQTVEQHAYLQVTPKGTTAAAATGVGVSMSATQATLLPIVIDHPFLFLVRDDATGAILFESMVENPAS